MPGNTRWSKGFYDEYQAISDQWNAARRDAPAKLEKFIGLIERDDDQVPLMEAHHQAFFAQGLPKKLQPVHDNWFGAEPMWFEDCTLEVGQIHQVMRWSRAWTAELLLAGGESVEFWIRCGHPRFRTVISWASEYGHQHLPTGGQAWSPEPIGGQVRVWVYTPFNSAYGNPSIVTDDERKAAEDTLRRLCAQPRRAHISEEDLHEVIDHLEAGRTIFQGTNLAVCGHPTKAPLPDASGLSVLYREDFEDPPRETAEVDRSMRLLPEPATGYERRANAIEISWRDAGPGRFLVHESDRAEAAVSSS